MAYNSFWALQAESCHDVLRDLHQELAAHFDAPKAFFLDAPNMAPPPPYQVRNGIAVIAVSGVIDRVARISFFTGLPYTEGQNRIRAALDAALADAKVRGILFTINSPGGAAAGTKELADAIADAGRIKPVAAYADGLCASAAYWLASATGQVYAPVTAQVGSIGVIAVLTDWSKAAEKAGVVRNIISSGQWKAAGSPDKPLTNEERELFQGQLATLHSIFKNDVASRMGIDAPETEWAEGQTILGARALELGLVSALVRDLAEAEAMLAASITREDSMDLKQLKAEHPELVEAIAKETRESCQQETQTAINQAKAEALELVKAIAGEEIAAKIETVAKAGITASQLSALAPILEPRTEADNSSEAQTREKILAGIQAATGQPLAGAGSRVEARKNALIADAERRANQRMVI